MTDYYNKYLLYKNKYLNLKYSQNRKQIIPFQSGSSYKLKENKLPKNKFRNLQRPTQQPVIKELKSLKVPIKHAFESIFITAQNSITEEFFKNNEKFNSDNSKINLTEDDLREGNIKAVTNDGKNYILKIVPFLTFNSQEKLLCYAWVNSYFLNFKNVSNKIMELKQRYFEILKRTDFLKFDCVSNYTQNHKSNLLFSDIVDLVRYILDGQGYLTFKFFDDKQKIERTEWLMITTITEADQPITIGSNI